MPHLLNASDGLIFVLEGTTEEVGACIKWMERNALHDDNINKKKSIYFIFFFIFQIFLTGSINRSDIFPFLDKRSHSENRLFPFNVKSPNVV